MDGDVNADVKVSMFQDGDSEKAEIKIRSIGCVSHLGFGKYELNAVAKLASLDVMRLLNTIKAAESQRVDPDQKTIEALQLLIDRINFIDEDQSRLWLEVELEMPIARGKRVSLDPVPMQLPGEESGDGWD